MIRFMRTVEVSEGKAAEAKQLAKEVTEYANTHFPEAKLQIFWQRFSVPTITFYLMADHEDLASLDRWLEQINSDEGFRELNSRWVDIFIEGIAEIAVLASV